MTVKLSIIYVNFQNPQDLVRSVKSLDRISDWPEREIIVVDNDREDFVFQDTRNYKLIKNLDNFGFAQACNLGAREAQGEILWFLNPDTEIISNDISTLLNIFSQDKAGIIGPKLITAGNKIQLWNAGYSPSIINLIRNNLGLSRDKKIWGIDKNLTVDWVSGTSLFIRKNLFEKINGFDEKFFMYFEDVDLCRRAAQAGYKTIYYPEFIVKHYGGKSFKDNELQKKYYYASQDYYFKKHKGKFQKNIVKVLRKIFI